MNRLLRVLLALVLLLSLVILSACSTTSSGGASEPLIELHAVSGSCQGDVDFYVRGPLGRLPVRLSLDYRASDDGVGHVGSAGAMMPLGSFVCSLSGEERTCSLAPGQIPFTVDAPQAVVDEGGRDESLRE